MHRAHPRSRGEHQGSIIKRNSITGSSPLARGTRLDRLSRSPARGLIPARAGNTGRDSRRGAPYRAHPRSRGEHGFRDDGKPHVEGSSPLARGTPVATAVSRVLRGLIPARAGNTFNQQAGAFLARAHPRSRGEHPLERRSGERGRGSSPLARGTLNSPHE